MPNEDWPPKDGDITHMIERLDALEEREGVRFESLNATSCTGIDGYAYVRVCGEIHARDGLEIPHQLQVTAIVYDPKRRVLNTAGYCVAAPEQFYGFQAFIIQLNAVGRIGKIRLYPQRS